MSEFKHLDDIEERESSDLRAQWVVAAVLGILVVSVVLALLFGP